jgi:Tetracyclin repressor-like, C-terminal domain
VGGDGHRGSLGCEPSLQLVGELDAQTSWKVSGLAVVTIGALWTQCHPSASMLAAYASDPTLASLRMEFIPAVTETVAILLTGALARAGT